MQGNKPEIDARLAGLLKRYTVENLIETTEWAAVQAYLNLVIEGLQVQLVELLAKNESIEHSRFIAGQIYAISGMLLPIPLFLDQEAKRIQEEDTHAHQHS